MLPAMLVTSHSLRFETKFLVHRARVRVQDRFAGLAGGVLGVSFPFIKSKVTDTRIGAGGFGFALASSKGRRVGTGIVRLSVDT